MGAGRSASLVPQPSMCMPMPFRAQRGGWDERALTPLLLTPPSPILGEHSSPKDEISLDSFTPESCQLAKTPDPFWNVTRPEKRKGGWCGRGRRRWGQGGEDRERPAAPPEVEDGVSGEAAWLCSSW